MVLAKAAAAPPLFSLLLFQTSTTIPTSSALVDFLLVLHKRPRPVRVFEKPPSKSMLLSSEGGFKKSVDGKGGEEGVGDKMEANERRC